MSRSPKEIIEAILANLEMARGAAQVQADRSHTNEDWEERDRANEAAWAYKHATKLIETEAASLLTDAKKEV